MKILEVLKIRKYLIIAIISSVIFGFFYIYTQVLGILDNLDLWFTVIPWYNAALFVIFAALFGITVSFQIYLWKQPKVCATSAKAKGGGVSGAATFVGLLIAQCPACASIGALFLPLSVLTIFTQFSIVFNLVSIGLLLFTINYLGGFRKM